MPLSLRLLRQQDALCPGGRTLRFYRPRVPGRRRSTYEGWSHIDRPAPQRDDRRRRG